MQALIGRVVGGFWRNKSSCGAHIPWARAHGYKFLRLRRSDVPFTGDVIALEKKLVVQRINLDGRFAKVTVLILLGQKSA
jgi:hypothetical protein